MEFERGFGSDPGLGDEIAEVLAEQGIEQEVCDEVAELFFPDALQRAILILEGRGKNVDSIFERFTNPPDEDW